MGPPGPSVVRMRCHARPARVHLPRGWCGFPRVEGRGDFIPITHTMDSQLPKAFEDMAVETPAPAGTTSAAPAGTTSGARDGDARSSSPEGSGDEDSLATATDEGQDEAQDGSEKRRDQTRDQTRDEGQGEGQGEPDGAQAAEDEAKEGQGEAGVASESNGVVPGPGPDGQEPRDDSNGAPGPAGKPAGQSKSSLMSFFRQSLGPTSGSDDDRSHRSFLKKRDTHDSDNVSSVGLAGSTDEASTSSKRSHLSLRRFLKKVSDRHHHSDKGHHGHHRHGGGHGPSQGHSDKHQAKEKGQGKEKKSHDLRSRDKSRGFHILPHAGSELYRKYTKGKLIGSGASGLVNLVHLRTDPTKIYAVKKFRAKLPQEAENDYKVKVNNEFKIGEILTHENLINTIELVKENHGGMFGSMEYYIIMEYCPYDFFNLVMLGLMDRPEVNCYIKQIVLGVNFLHTMGLAHRDLKLDNCVVNGQGILKLIDFGSAVQFRKPVDQVTNKLELEIITINGKEYKLLLSRGIVGSDPYLSPEVFDPDIEPVDLGSDLTPVPNYTILTGTGATCDPPSDSSDTVKKGYDARKVDIWSIAIIYCCMVLRRFPWKIPQDSDSSYKGFAKNPEKLFKLLPKESHDWVAHMLCDTSERYLIEEVVNHDFIRGIDQCTSEKRAEDHKHHLVTETELEQINKEKEISRKLKNSGMA